MVEAGYVVFDGQAGERSDKRHECLKESEGQGHSQRVGRADLLVGGACNDGDGKGVHCQAECDKDDSDKIHALILSEKAGGCI